MANGMSIESDTGKPDTGTSLAEPEENGPPGETDKRVAEHGSSAGEPERAAPAEQPRSDDGGEPQPKHSLQKQAEERAASETDASEKPERAGEPKGEAETERAAEEAAPVEAQQQNQAEPTAESVAESPEASEPEGEPRAEASEPTDERPQEGQQRATHSGEPSATILVDPTLEQEAMELTRRKSDPSIQTGDATGEEEPPQPAEPSSELSAFDAERFADSFRPSWEAADEPELADLFAKQVAPTTGSALEEAASDAGARDSDIDGEALPELPVSKDNRKTLLLAAASTAAVALLIGISISVATQEHELPEEARAETAPTPADEPASSAAPALPVQQTEAVPQQVEAETEAQPAEPALEPSAANEAETEPPLASAGQATASLPAPSPEAKPNVPRTAPTRKQAQRNAVHIRITTSPASARLSLDGSAVPNPFDAWVARGGEHRFSASAEGYVEQSRMVSFDGDRTVSLVLSPLAKPPTVSPPPAPKTPARTVTARPRTPRKRVKSTATRSRKRGAGFVSDNPY